MNILKTILHQTTVKLLTPIVKILLSQGLSFSDFISIARQVFVDVAEIEFSIPGKKQTDSRISVITGINRKDVHRCRLMEESDETKNTENVTQFNRVERVIHGWVKDHEFHGGDKKPRSLKHTKGEDEFDQLIKRYSGDMPTRAMLDEMLRLKLVEKTPERMIRLLSNVYIPDKGIDDKLPLLGRSASDLINTISHNFEHSGEESKLQLNVEYHDVSIEVAMDFKRYSEERAYELLQELNQWLDEKSSVVNDDDEETSLMRVGLGIYYFDERTHNS